MVAELAGAIGGGHLCILHKPYIGLDRACVFATSNDHRANRRGVVLSRLPTAAAISSEDLGTLNQHGVVLSISFLYSVAESRADCGSVAYSLSRSAEAQHLPEHSLSHRFELDWARTSSGLEWGGASKIGLEAAQHTLQATPLRGLVLRLDLVLCEVEV